MRIYAAQRRVSLSVGELASFRLGPDAAHGAGGRWRMALGSAWHESLHAELRADSPTAARTEVSLNAVLLHEGWRFELSGRIDQVSEAPGAPTVIRELKTTSLSLPAAEADLRQTYPHYFRQVALYACGWLAQHTPPPVAQERLSLTAQDDSPPVIRDKLSPVTQDSPPRTAPKASASGAKNSLAGVESSSHVACNGLADIESSPPVVRNGLADSAPLPQPPTQMCAGICAELCLVNIHDGTRQTVQMNAAQAQREAKAALSRIVPFLEARARTRLHSDEAERALPAFEQYREGQPEALEALSSRLLTSPVTVFEAPTGFGKTGIALEMALEQMRLNVFSRVIYLSGKSTGQHQVMRQLRQMNAQTQWRFFQLRSRREHTEQPPRQRAGRKSTPFERPHSELNWQDFGICPEQLLDEQRADVDSLRSLGARTGLCPYELAKGCLPFADIWVGDYNYVFSARHRRVFFERPGFDPAQTLLIVDEAHNLPARVADNLSLSLSAATAEAVALDLRLADAPFLLVQAWEAWTAFLQGIKPAPQLPPTIIGEAAAHLNLLCERMEAVDADAFAPFTREALAETVSQAQTLVESALPYLAWSPRHGLLNITCLDAAAAIGETLGRFGASLLMTATPGPHDVLAQSLGVEPQQIHFVPAATPWRNDAYDVAIDATVDTRLRARPQYYQQTADTIGRFALDARGPLTVFFPSYQYAEVVLKYLEALHPALIVKVQPRAIAPGGQLTFVEESLLLAHVLFFVLGSSFSESIDHLGGRVDRAMIVGPALPEVNPVQDARLAQLEPLGREEAFRRVYQIPALQKINQALGRLVRAPGQSARVLLHDQRFAQNSYRSLLDPEYRQAQVLTDEVSLREWIAR